MSDRECAAVIILTVTVVLIMTEVMFFVCRGRGQGNRVLPTAIPPCPPKKGERK